jgi:hypothetical protein
VNVPPDISVYTNRPIQQDYSLARLEFAKYQAVESRYQAQVVGLMIGQVCQSPDHEPGLFLAVKLNHGASRSILDVKPCVIIFADRLLGDKRGWDDGIFSRGEILT